MIRHRRVLVRYVLGVIVATLIGVVLIGWDNIMHMFMPAPVAERIDFATRSGGDTSNRFLACPEGYCAGPPDRISPVFDVPAAALRDRWNRMVEAEPRVTRTGSADDALQYDVVQRSRFFRFPDLITVRFVPLGDTRSTLAVYSRSRYGREDFGVNRKRVEAWLAALAS
jgi:uncharacterized protein (DUF1499 family)